MKVLDINSNGGTCDRCGKGLVNVAVISDEAGTHTVGLDCLQKVEVSDFQTKRQIKQAVKDARELGTIKKLVAKGELKTKFELGSGGGKVYYWQHPVKSWQWIGLAEQNTKGLRREIWELVTQ